MQIDAASNDMPSPASETIALPGRGDGGGRQFRASVRLLLRRVFSYPVALAAGIVMITVLSLTVRFDNPDLWLHLRIGKEIWTTRSIPSTAIFSFRDRKSTR